jgi:hypothetical protein
MGGGEFLVATVIGCHLAVTELSLPLLRRRSCPEFLPDALNYCRNEDDGSSRKFNRCQRIGRRPCRTNLSVTNRQPRELDGLPQRIAVVG